MSKHQIILASGSQARQEMLGACGLDFTARPAEINEGALQKAMVDRSPEDVAVALAKAKAQYISHQAPDAIVIGSDQILELDGEILSKAPDVDAAREKLKMLRGKTHRLISAVAVVRDEEVLWTYNDIAYLTMHDFDDVFLESYLKKAGNALTSCVGAYALEAHGPWLFDKINGTYHTILGMPLAPLLNFLRKNHQVSL